MKTLWGHWGWRQEECSISRILVGENSGSSVEYTSAQPRVIDLCMGSEFIDL